MDKDEITRFFGGVAFITGSVFLVLIAPWVLIPAAIIVGFYFMARKTGNEGRRGEQRQSAP